MEKEGKKTTAFMAKALSVFFVGTFLLRFIFAVVYFRQIGLSSTYSGILQGASPLSTAIGGITLGYIADRADRRKLIFVISYFAYAITPFLLTLPEPANHCLNNSGSKTNISQDGQITSLLNHFKTNPNKSKGFGSDSKSTFQITTTKISPLQTKLNHLSKQERMRKGKSKPFTNSTILSHYKTSTYILDNSPELVSEVQRNRENGLKSERLQIYQGQKRMIRGNGHNSLDSFDGEGPSPKKLTKMVNMPTFKENNNRKKWLFISLLIIIIISDFFSGAAINLADTVLVEASEDKKQYGRFRAWGNVSQAVTIPLAAILTYFKTVEICGESVGDYKLALYMTSIISATGWLLGIFAVHFPSSKGDDHKKHGTSEKASLKDLITPLGNWSLLVNAFFFGAFHGAVSSFLFWKMIDLDQNQANLSIAVANFARNTSSLAVSFFSPQILHKIGYRNTMSVSCLTFGIGFTVAAFMRSSWLGITVEILAGAGFAFAFNACVSYMSQVAPPELAVTAQGLLHSMYTGIGLAAGPALAGFLMDKTDQTVTFLIFAGMTILVMVFSMIVQWIMKIREGDYQKLATEEEDK